MALQPPGWRFYLVLILACPLTFLVHEGAHWLMGQGLGYSMTMSLNGASPRGGGFTADAHAMWVSAAGPLVTLLQGVVAFLLIRSGRNLLAYPFLFIAWMMRFAAAVVSIKHPNDEARISQMLGLGTWTLPVLMVVALFALLYLANRRLQVGWRANLISYLIASMMFAAIVFVDA
jgi:hypothetical protein